MDIGIPKEIRDNELRVGLGSNSVAQLVDSGHNVYVETDAGTGAGFTDEEYARAGATIVYSVEEVYKRSQVVCSVTTPPLEHIDEMQPGQIICTFGHLSAASTARFNKLREKEVTVFAYEMLQEGEGRFPIRRPLSQIAGQLVPQVAASLLESPNGRGLLLAGIPGIPPAEVCVLGAGEVGFNATRAFVGLGTQVTVLDNPERLAKLDRMLPHGRVRLMHSYPDQIARAVAFCNVFVGAILVPGSRTPHLVTEEMVSDMRPGAVIVDVSIDQGGCVETARPTSLRDPTFEKHGVTHYCVPNFTALVARTASRALSNVLRPCVLRLTADPKTMLEDPVLRSAVVLYEGRVVNPLLAAAQDAELEELS